MADELERWPGYNEQSWSQRFAELDRIASSKDQRIVVLALQFAARIQSDAAEVAVLKAQVAEARGNVTALETSLHAHNCGMPGCLCISTSIRD